MEAVLRTPKIIFSFATTTPRAARIISPSNLAGSELLSSLAGKVQIDSRLGLAPPTQCVTIYLVH